MELWYTSFGNDRGKRTVRDVSVHALEDAFDRKTVAVWADNGCHIEGEDTDCAKTAGLGIPTMKERVRLTNGNFEIHSKPGQGTQISVELPL